MAESSTLMWAVHQDLPPNILPPRHRPQKPNCQAYPECSQWGEKRARACSLGLPRLRFVPSTLPELVGPSRSPSDFMPCPALSQDTSLHLLSGKASPFTSFLSHRWGGAGLPPPTIIRNPRLPLPHLLQILCHLMFSPTPKPTSAYGGFHISRPYTSDPELYPDSTLPWISSCFSGHLQS